MNSYDNGLLVQDDLREWKPMRRAFGAVFDAINPPTGLLYLRFQVSARAGDYSVESKNAIPNDWKVGATYDTQIQLD